MRSSSLKSIKTSCILNSLKQWSNLQEQQHILTQTTEGKTEHKSKKKKRGSTTLIKITSVSRTGMHHLEILAQRLSI